MNWQEIRRQYPHRWLLLEATRAQTQGAQRVVEEWRVVDDFGDDWEAAWAQYKHVHRSDRSREYYVLHTDRAELNIGVLDVFGRAVRD